MDDATLRELERAATTAPDARLRYARALERHGRHDEALDAVLGQVGDPRIREAIVRFPVWADEANATRFRPVSPKDDQRDELLEEGRNIDKGSGP